MQSHCTLFRRLPIRLAREASSIGLCYEADGEVVSCQVDPGLKTKLIAGRPAPGTIAPVDKVH